MARYIIRRLLIAVVTVFVISVLTFVIIQAPPGDFVTTYINQMQASGSLVSQAEAEMLRNLYGLDQPIWVQYWKWVSRMIYGDFGMSMEFTRPVLEVISDRMILTIIHSVSTVLVSWAIALPIGIYSAVRQYSIIDYVATFVAFVGLAVPSFLVSIICMYFAFTFFGANIGGLFSPEFANAPWSWARVGDLLVHLPLPVFILALGSSAQLIRIMRANLLDELRKPYLVTALSKGLSPRRAILKYPVRVALNPFLSTIGHILPYIVSGSVIVSLVLGLPTVGPVLYKALISQDMFLAGTIVLFLGLLTVIGTLMSDLLLVLVDPRIRAGG
jgi:peptide/nickel transport system permease protein